jgi:hypothetical protein
MTSTSYKGFEIIARPSRLGPSWTVAVEIRRYGRARSFSIGGRYQTEADANVQCRDLGQRIIDGNVPGWSVDGIRHERTGISFTRVLQNFLHSR